MNIQEQLFKIYNKVKYNSEYWGKLLEESNKRLEGGEEATERDGEIFYNATFYEGASRMGKMFLNTYNGDSSDSDLEFWIGELGRKLN